MKTCFAMVMVAAVLGGCTNYTDDFKDRLIAQNTQIQLLMNQEALLNVVRASRHEPLSFIALTETSGSRQQTLGLGLPSLTIGPGRTSAQRQFAFAGNSESNQVQGSFKANPLVSDNFQMGMLTPISTRQLAFLIAAYGRETMLLAAIDQIRINDTFWTIPAGLNEQQRAEFMKKNLPRKESHIFRNDPSNNDADGSDEACSATQYLPDPQIDRTVSESDGMYVNHVIKKITAQSSDKYYLIGDMRKCHFAKFRALLTALLHVGLTVDVIEAEKKEVQNTSKGGNNTAAAQDLQPGKFCLSAALVDPPIDLIQGATLLGAFGRCEYVPPGQAEFKTPLFRDIDGVDHQERRGYLDEVSIRLRSPIAIYKYLGEVMRSYNAGKGPAGLFTYSTADAKQHLGLGDHSAFLNVVEGGDDCAIAVDDGDQSYCVKMKDVSTQNLLAMLQDLRNLNTKTADLSSASIVRVQP